MSSSEMYETNWSFLAGQGPNLCHLGINLRLRSRDFSPQFKVRCGLTEELPKKEATSSIACCLLALVRQVAALHS